MSHRGLLVGWLVLCGLLACGIASGGGIADGDEPGRLAPTQSEEATGNGGAITETFGQGQPEADATVVRVELEPTGAAVWELGFRTRLETESDLENYRRFQAAVRENTSRYLDSFRDRMTNVAENANGTLPRTVQATGFEANTSIQELPQRWGVLTFRTTVQGFASVEGDRIVVGDVFQGGFFIDDGFVFAVAAPDGYAIETADPEPESIDEDVAQWRGPAEFDDERPRVVVTPRRSNGGSGLLLPALVGGVLVVLLVAGIGYIRGMSPVDSTATIRDRAEQSDDTGVKTEADDDTDDQPAATTPEASRSGASQTAADDGDSTAADDPLDDELLTDEDHVNALLEDRGGRMKQGDIVEALDWSKSKTSRVLSRMAEDDEIRKLQIGRENVIERVDDESSPDEHRE